MFQSDTKIKQRRGTGFVFDQQKDDLEKQRKSLELKFNEIHEKTENIVLEEEEENPEETNSDVKETVVETTQTQEIRIEDNKKYHYIL